MASENVYSNLACARCGKTPKELIPPWLDHHHIIPLSKGGLDTANNLQLLCSSCHKQVHREYNEKHPKAPPRYKIIRVTQVVNGMIAAQQLPRESVSETIERLLGEREALANHARAMLDALRLDSERKYRQLISTAPAATH